MARAEAGRETAVGDQARIDVVHHPGRHPAGDLEIQGELRVFRGNDLRLWGRARGGLRRRGRGGLRLEPLEPEDATEESAKPRLGDPSEKLLRGVTCPRK